MSCFAAAKKFAAVILGNEFNQASNSDAGFPNIGAPLLAERRPVLRHHAAAQQTAAETTIRKFFGM